MRRCIFVLNRVIRYLARSLQWGEGGGGGARERFRHRRRGNVGGCGGILPQEMLKKKRVILDSISCNLKTVS